MNFLDQIAAKRRARIAIDRAATSPATLARAAGKAREGKSALRLQQTLQSAGVNIIGEFKRASPSAETLRADADVSEVVNLYDHAGVRAVSILTEPEFFRGSLDDLRDARAATPLPILRKDFVVDEYQIDEAAVAGADAILLIVALLSDEEVRQFRTRAEEMLGLDALVEVHTREEFARAVDCGAKLIGVNNRDLRTLQTSLEISFELGALAPPEITLVSESGLSNAQQIARLRQCGYAGFLIGESLLRSRAPASLLRSLRGEELEQLRNV